MLIKKQLKRVLLASAIILPLAISNFTFSNLAQAKNSSNIEIPFTKFTLDNGLTLIVHEDHKAPIVAVSVWYKVGSKDEPKGKTGFAHLFEHLMFNGSENYNDEYFGPFHKVGATAMNGTTWFDRTNYFQNVPTSAIDMALWMESDRMGHLLGAIDQAKLDEQRGVVQNEKRQGDNQPYGQSEYSILEGLFPVGHPYRHSTIGSMEDLNAASLDDVKSWFKAYYGASNAVVVLAGDIDTKNAKILVEKYFGDIEAGPAVTSHKAWIPTRLEDTEEVMYEKVPQTRIYKSWVIPGRTKQDTAQLTVAASILGEGKNSRLYQELIYKNQYASNLNVYVERHQLNSQFHIEVTLKDGVSADTVNAIVEKELDRLMKNKPSKNEMKRAKIGISAALTRGLEQIGGFGGKATALARGELYAGDPAFYKTRASWIAEVSAKEVMKVTKKWLSKGRYQLTILPIADHKVAKGVDRSKGLPEVIEMPSLNLPKTQRAKLKNGLNVVLMENHTVPVVNLTMQFDAGYAADSAGFKLGTASYTLAMLDEGTSKMSALEIASEAELLGANINTASNLDMSTVSLSALKSNLKDSIKLYADIIKKPAFENSEIERLRGTWLAKITQEKSRPVQMALRNLPPILYGKEHAYGIPFTGSGTEESINSLTQKDLKRFYKTWIRPDNATLYIVGDTNLNDILPMLNKQFGSWKASKKALPEKNITDVFATHRQVIIIDKPDSPQSLILAGELAPATGAKNNIAINAMNDVIGGNFNARVNMNLREDKHWAYGAYTFLQDARGQRPYFVYAPVQTDKTGASIKELLKELSSFTADKPATKEELSRTIQNNVNSLPGAYETSRAMMGSLLSNQRFNRPDDYVAQLTNKYESLTLEQVNAAAKQVVKHKQLTWMIVGDRKEIEKQLEGIDLGEKVFMDADGNIIK